MEIEKRARDIVALTEITELDERTIVELMKIEVMENRVKALNKIAEALEK